MTGPGDTQRLPPVVVSDAGDELETSTGRRRFGTHGMVAIIIAVGLVTAVNVITLAVLIDALRSEGPGLSENATQVLTGAFGGMIGILGSQLGYRAGLAQNGNGER